eukprot:7199753-Pyramimonas_sp.AAC.1
MDLNTRPPSRKLTAGSVAKGEGAAASAEVWTKEVWGYSHDGPIRRSDVRHAVSGMDRARHGHRTIGHRYWTPLRPYQAISSLENSTLPPIVYGRPFQ